MSDTDDVGTQRAAMTAVADDLKEVLDPIFARHGLCYALIVYPPQPPGFGRYVSNGPTERMIESLKELVTRVEAGDIVPDPVGGES